MKQVSLAILILSLLGAAVAAYSFLSNQGLASSAFCTINETFDCDVVNKGAYSRILGIPVSAIGIVGYLVIAATMLLRRKFPGDRGMDHFLLAASTGGLLFSLYLTGIEAFILDTWCLLCLASQTLILAIFILSIVLWKFHSTAPSAK